MKPVTCDDCGHEWRRDPVLEVACPTCHAPIGRWCRKPSGHPVWTAYGRFHGERDLAADAAGHYRHDCTRSCERCNVATHDAPPEPEPAPAIATTPPRQEELAL